MKQGISMFVLLFGVLCVASSASGASLYVSPVGTNDIANKYNSWSGASTSIQVAVNAAVGGDTVWVTNAPYVVNQIDVGTNITLISTNGSGDGARAVLDGNNAARCFYLHHTGAVMRGFTIIRGYTVGDATSGGSGGRIDGGTVEHCVISDCVTTNSAPTVQAQGGALFVKDGTVRDCTIVSNRVYGNGAGLYVTNGLVERCTINTNLSVRVDPGYAWGGGIYATMSTIRDCEINGNGNPLFAGGVFLSGSNSLMERCLVVSNSAQGAGGVYVADKATFRDGTSSWNFATGGGNFFGAGGLQLDAGTVSNCLISDNRVGNIHNLSPTCGGGGAWLTGSDALLADCRIVRNIAGSDPATTYGNGGGVFMAAGTVSTCLISSNQAIRKGPNTGGTGQGVTMLGGVMRDSIISYNREPATSDGVSGGSGAVCMKGGSLLHSTIISNHVRGWLAGVAMVGATSAKLVSDCIIQGNDSTEGWIGGVAMLDTTNNTLRNSLIINNDVPGSGGGVYLEQGAIENCTVARNKCSGSGGGIYRNAAGVNSITNTIVYYNSATTSGNDIFNPDNSRFGYCCSPDLTAGSNGNITNAPGFVYAGSGYGLTAELGDYRLTPRSPCVDKGAYLSWMNGATDLVGKKRIFRGVVDMGAFEDDTPCGTVICIR